MNIEKIKIKDNCYVWVDKDADVENVCYYYNSFDKEIRKGSRLHQKYHYKIIAASAELELEGVPDYYLLLRDNYIKRKTDKWSQDDINRYGHEVEEDAKCFIDGYKTAEQELFTEEDLKKAIELAIYFERSKDKNDNKFINPLLEQNIIEQIKSE